MTPYESVAELDGMRDQLSREFQSGRRPHVRDRLRMRGQPDLGADELARICGIHGGRALELLIRQESRPEQLATLVLVPLVLVGWADHRLTPRERGEILDAAERSGIRPGTPAFNLLGGWLERRPGVRLREAWVGYVRALTRELTCEECGLLSAWILDPVRRIANVGGAGYRFGLTSQERGLKVKVVNELAKAFVPGRESGEGD